MKKVEVSFSPILYPHKLIKTDFNVVIVDIFRATTSICAALDFGIERIIPVGALEEAQKHKKNGLLVACERNGQLLEFADLGNSPSDFQKKHLSGQKIVFSTTNGTKAIHLANDADHILIGSFINLNALAQHLSALDQDVVILCAGWKKLFNLEDSIFAGALAQTLISNYNFTTECDAAKAGIELWEQAANDLPGYLSIASHRHRLKHLLSDQDYHFSLKIGISPVVPEFRNNEILDQATAKKPLNSRRY